MATTQDEIVSDVVRNLLRPPAPSTLSLDRPAVRLHGPAASHVDWQTLPELAVAEIFRHLPVVDLFRVGYIFTPLWREIWRRDPLLLHDKQFSMANFKVADALTCVLESYVDGIEDEAVDGLLPLRRRVESFRVESTPFGPGHASRWCAALKRGRAIEVVIFNRAFHGQSQPATLVRLPPALLACSTLQILHLGFFTVEAGELDALTEVTDLGLHGCACRPGVVEVIIASCRDLHELYIHYGALYESIAVRAAHALRTVSFLKTWCLSLTVDDVPALLELVPGNTPVLSISGAPSLRNLTRLSLPSTTLEIGSTEIAVGMQAKQQPRMLSVESLWLTIDYTALGAMEGGMVSRMVHLMLRSFPFVTHLTIERRDAAPHEEGLASGDDGDKLDDSFKGVAKRLSKVTLYDFRASKAELALVKNLMDEIQELELAYIPSRHAGHAVREAQAALLLFRPLSAISVYELL